MNLRGLVEVIALFAVGLSVSWLVYSQLSGGDTSRWLQERSWQNAVSIWAAFVPILLTIVLVRALLPTP